MRDAKGAGASRGSSGTHNEDTFLCDDSLGLYVICDGLSSQPGGEVAAYLAVEAIGHYLTEVEPSGALRSEAVTLSILEDALAYALECIEDAVEIRPDLSGMATTITVLLIQGRRGLVSHVGDSRVYLIRDRRCVQLTADQEWTEARENDAGRAKASEPFPETFGLELDSGDLLVLCTDGAEHELEHPEWLRDSQSASPRLLASRIVAAAHRRSAGSDATVVVVRLRQDSGAHAGHPDSRSGHWIREAHGIDRGAGQSERTPPDRARFESIWDGRRDRTRRPGSG